MKISLDNLNPKINSEIKNFYHSYYSDDNRIFTDNYLPWLLNENPHGKGFSLNIKIDDDLVANMFLIPVTLIKKGLEKKAYYVVDVLTHPMHRDKNLFVKMIRFAIEILHEKNAYLIGHPNANAMPGWRRTKMNFQPPMQSFFSKPSFKHKKKRVTSASEFTSAEKEKIYSILSEQSFFVVKSDFEFMLWRYINNPLKKYKIEIIYSADEIIGLVVSYKIKKFIDRVVHYMYKEGVDRKVFKSSLIPRVFSFSHAIAHKGFKDSFYNKPFGHDINFFFSGFDGSVPTESGIFITFAACDN